MVKETLEELKGAVGKAHEALKRELAKLRTGRAHPSLLDSIRVDAYGQPTPISQMASAAIRCSTVATVTPPGSPRAVHMVVSQT